jgi:hypothetical protein
MSTTTYINSSKTIKDQVETISGATTLNAGDSGKVFILSASAGAEITLPSPMAGVNYKFIVGSAFATTDWTIVSATDVTQGSVIVAGTHVAGSNENTVSFVASAESIGDFVEYVSNGTSWFVNGSGVTSGAITFTAP